MAVIAKNNGESLPHNEIIEAEKRKIGHQEALYIAESLLLYYDILKQIRREGKPICFCRKLPNRYDLRLTPAFGGDMLRLFRQILPSHIQGALHSIPFQFPAGDGKALAKVYLMGLPRLVLVG